MDVKELRINNYITANGVFNPFKNYLTICGLDDVSITTKYWSDEGECWQKVRNKDNYIGIQLTKEWLLKFGFEYNYDETFLVLRNYMFGTFTTDESVDFGIVYFRTTCGDTKIKHVHQLQNLYYALTGKELNEQ